MVQDPTAIRLRDCGHVGYYTGVCQYKGCAYSLCMTCNWSCEACGRTLCPFHQDWIDGCVLCPEDAKTYRIRRLLRTLIPWT